MMALMVVLMVMTTAAFSIWTSRLGPGFCPGCVDSLPPHGGSSHLSVFSERHNFRAFPGEPVSFEGTLSKYPYCSKSRFFIDEILDEEN